MSEFFFDLHRRSQCDLSSGFWFVAITEVIDSTWDELLSGALEGICIHYSVLITANRLFNIVTLWAK